MTAVENTATAATKKQGFITLYTEYRTWLTQIAGLYQVPENELYAKFTSADKKKFDDYNRQINDYLQSTNNSELVLTLVANKLNEG